MRIKVKINMTRLYIIIAILWGISAIINFKDGEFTLATLNFVLALLNIISVKYVKK